MHIKRFIRRRPVLSFLLITLFLMICVVTYFGSTVVERFLSTYLEEPQRNDFVVAAENVGAIYTDLADEIERGDLELIQRELETKAAATENMVERGMLLLTLAQTIIAVDLEKGVQKYKELAADETLPPAFRASALISLFSLYSSGTADPALLDAAVFSGEPYAALRPRDTSSAAREAAYIELLIQAETLQQSMIANAYLAHYYARTAFLDPDDTAAREGAATRLYILDYYLKNTPESPLDSSLPIAEILNGTAELYLSSTNLIDVSEHIDQISGAFYKLARTAEASLIEAAKFQGSNAAAQNASKAGFLHTEAVLWDTVLRAAVTVAAERPDITSKIGDKYAEYILSPQGEYERERAQSAESTIVSEIEILKLHSQTLQNILSNN